MDDILKNKYLEGSDHSIRTIGYFLIFTTLVTFGSWAAFAPISSATIAPATITVKSHRKTIQHLTGGIVERIHVADGDFVNKGDVLVVLDGSELSTQYKTALLQSYELQAKLSRLQAEMENLPLLDSHYKPNLDSLAFQQVWRAQVQAFNARKEAKDGEITILEVQILQARQQIQRLNALSKNRSELAHSLEKDLRDYNKLVNKGFLGKKNIQDLTRLAIEYRGEQNEFAAEALELATQIQELELRKEQIYSSFIADITSEIDLTKEKLHEVNKQVNVLNEQLSRLEIIAPVSGRVMNAQVHTLGGVIGAGEPIIEIVPHNDELILTARISPTDIEDVHKGLEANIRLTSFSDAYTPEVIGEVLTVSADQLINKDNEAYFEAKVVISPDSMKEIQNLQLSAGMPAEVLILTGSRTFMEYLLKPLSDSISRSFIEK